jgi:hypothetical protein
MNNNISEERLNADDKIINFLSLFGLGWAAFAWNLWRLPWFWTEALQGGGAAWWSLLAVLLTSIALTPLGFVWLTFNWRGKEVTKQWKEETSWLLLGGVPSATIWAALWIYCLPHVWTLLPWGPWEYNWWKIFPYLFGLIWMGLMPLVGLIIEVSKKLKNPVFIGDEIKEFGERTLQNGMNGGDVRTLQELLNKHGASISVDGRFGNQTRGAVTKFQTDMGLTIDGIVGNQTTSALLKEDEIVDAANILKESLANISGKIVPEDTGAFTSILDGLDVPEEN